MEFLEKIVGKIENSVNRLLWWLWSKLTIWARRLTPKFVSNFKEKIRNKLKKAYSFIKGRIIFVLEKSKTRPLLIINYIKNLSPRAIFSQAKKKVSPQDLKSLKSIGNSKFTQIKEQVTQLLQMIHQRIKTLPPIYLYSSILMGGLFLTIGPLFYIEIKEIYLGLRPPEKERKPAKESKSEEEGNFTRPSYHKGETRYFNMENITFPVYLFNSKNSIKSLIMDISIQSSNRFIPLYFSKHEHEIRDHLNSNFHPILPEFPLENEGKDVLREKIKIELNNYLVKKKIRGEIQQVYIHGIIGG